jgi:amino acid transporter
MADQLSATSVPAPPARLEPDAIGVAQDTIIGMATSAPAAVVAFILASLAMTANYGGGFTIIVTGIPMVIIAYTYHRLNRWNANSGASFEWVGRSINPYLGFMTGWLMIAGYVLGTLSGVTVLGPNVLAVFNNAGANKWGNVGIATAIGLLMILIAVVGIKLTARVQVVMAIVEYAILVGVSVWGLFYVLGHHAGTVPITSGWFSLSGIGGKGDAVGGFLIAVFAFSGWDGTIYVNEEVKHRRVNPGRAAILAVVLLTVIYALAQIGLQGVLSPDKLQNSPAPLVDIGTALGGSTWGKLMALSVALSGIATTGTGIVVGSRIVYGMASYRALPEFLANVPRRFATPAAASIVVGGIVVVLAWVYLLATSVQSAFGYITDLTGILFALFYVLTALATIVYYRRRILAGVVDAITLGLLPLGSAAFLVWMSVKALSEKAAPEKWTMLGILVAGLLLMLVARFVLESPFFSVRRETDTGTDPVDA